MAVIWDGAPRRRAKFLTEKAASLGLELLRPPGYSPDPTPIEGLWKWMREEVTQHRRHASLRDLFKACTRFVDRINEDPREVVRRLWPRFELASGVEQLRFSG